MNIHTQQKTVRKLLQEVGNLFNSSFVNNHPGALILRSKDPGVCWKAAGQIAYASIAEFSGPHVNDSCDNAPTLFRLKVNLQAPPALFYHLNSPAVRHKLCISSRTTLADDPLLEVTAHPKEIAELGKWLALWLEHKFYNSKTPPVTPIALETWVCDENMKDHHEDFNALGEHWIRCEYLWTPSAASKFSAWLRYIDF